MKNTLARILAGSIAALAILPTIAKAADINITTSYTGAASGLSGSAPGGNWGSNNLRFGNGGAGTQTYIINSGTLQGTQSGARSFEINGTSNVVTFTGSSTAVIVASTRNWGTGSVKINGTSNTMNVSAGATFTANGWNGFEGTNNIINVTGAGSVATFSADANDGFGNSSPSADTATGCRLNILAGGAVYVNSGVHTFTSSTAGTYAINVDGTLGASVLGVREFGDFSASPAGGVLRAFNGGALERLPSSGSAWNLGGGPYNKFLIDGGVLSYKGTSGVNMGESLSAGGVSQFIWTNVSYGGNVIRLNNSTASDTGSYTLANNLGAKNYTRLEMVNGTTSVARAITIDGGNGGSILFDSTTGTVTNGVTLTGAATMTVNGTASSLTGVIGSSGSLTKTGTGSLTLRSANTYTGATTVSNGILKAGVASVAGVSGAFGLNSDVTLANTAGVFLDITGFNTQIGALAGGGTVTLGAATLTVNEATATSYSGAITGTGGTAGTLLKKGAGTLSLNGVQTYGTLTTDEGTTIVNSAVGTGASTVNANAGTTMKFGTVSQKLASLTIGAGATVTFTSGVATFSGGGKASGFGAAVVPEPGTLGMLLVGAFVVMGYRRS